MSDTEVPETDAEPATAHPVASAHPLTLVLEPDGCLRSVVETVPSEAELPPGLPLTELARRVAGSAADPAVWVRKLDEARATLAVVRFDTLVEATGNATQAVRRQVVVTPVPAAGGELGALLLQFSLGRHPGELPEPTEERFSFLAESLPMLLWIAQPDGSLEYVSPQWEAFTGIPVPEILASGYYGLVHPDDLPAVVALKFEFDADDRFTYPVFRLRHGVDGFRPVETVVRAVRDEHGQLTRIVGATMDVSERSTAEAAKRRATEQLRAALDVSGLGLFEYDFTTRMCILDDRFRTVFGIEVTAQEQPLLPLEVASSHIYPDDVPRIREAIRAVIDGTADWYRESYRIVRPGPAGPETRWITSVGRREPGAGLPRLVGVIQDVTAVRAAAAARLGSQKREALGTLASGIAHDFNNLIGAIAMNAEVIDAELQHGVRPDESVEEIRRATERATQLVRRLVDLSRDEEPEQVPFDLAEIAREVCALMRPTLRRVSLVGPPADLVLPPVLGSASQLHQVIVNLVANAGDALEERGGEVVVSVGTVDLDGSIDATTLGRSTLRAGRYVQLVVRDDGPGIAPEVLPRIFDPFFTTKRPGRGTGLGLASAQSIVSGHGGVITADNRSDGAGAEFTVLLPAAPTSE